MSERGKASTTIAICFALWVVFAAIAWSAVSGKSPTEDEPSHAVTGWFNLYAGDFRLSPDVPPLWEEWIALAMGPQAIHYDPKSSEYQTIRVHHNVAASGVVPWDVKMLYRTPANDGFEIMRRARMMSLLLGVALAALIGRWAWRLGGAAAAVAATFVYVWDPNFLGHAPLVKNDVPTALAFLAGAYAIWRVGVKLTWRTAIAAMAATAAAVLVKFSGAMLGPVMALALTLRAVDSSPWPIFGRAVACRAAKLAVAFGVCLATALFTYGAIWASYDFRFDSGPSGLRLDAGSFLDTLRYVQVFNQTHRPPTPQELSAWQFPASTRAILYARDHHLLPEALTIGAILTQSGSESRLCYLLGRLYNGGKWYYFPLAAFFKSPLATLLAAGLALWCAVRALRKGALRDPAIRWSAIALILPAAAYATAAITSNVNIGLRHAFPVYPFVFIGIGLAAARAWSAGRGARGIVLLLAVGLATETAAAFPNFISFFDIAWRDSAYGLLSDSNVDWGQDLPALRQWQVKHPDVTLYLDYFGRADPAAYGIQYENLAVFDNHGKLGGSYPWGPPPVTLPDTPGELAISSTNLHLAGGLANVPPAPWFGLISGRQPDEILNGTIYLYRIGP
jgi:hypothetical protein